MAFPEVPTESRSKINKAGDILRDPSADLDSLTTALDLAERWRACHSYPINTFQAHLRTKLKLYHKDAIAAQRLKRMPTIVDKLKRYPSMPLATMQDIGGLRAIMPSVKEAIKLAEDYRANHRLLHALVDDKDYIHNPRDADGYRSIHLIWKYANIRAPRYNGLRIELQIRSKLQHTWATAVETMGTLLGQALKSRQGDKEWLDFFALVSSAFAHKEGTPPVPRFSHLGYSETCNAIRAAEKKLTALDKMKAFSVAVQSISKNKAIQTGSSFHLIVLNSIKRTVQVRSYDRANLQKALDDYSSVEKEASRGDSVEPVLVGAGSVNNIRKAYPNFFLDIGGFIRLITDMTAGTK
ncbi:MAG TPA: RelA/SpoT domain-containing protein [Kiritimatiellia bacterium]|nr:RelA/SpoT domain-containing protein [Saprospiraceae bacterium]HMP00809.1 RelA/SpoT domain-containing protein [Kiritimatiellia bacterium]